jgi:hypothetical protein
MSKNAIVGEQINKILDRLPETIESDRDAAIAMNVIQDYCQLLDKLSAHPEIYFDRLNGVTAIVEETGIHFNNMDDLAGWISGIMH